MPANKTLHSANPTIKKTKAGAQAARPKPAAKLKTAAKPKAASKPKPAGRPVVSG